MKQFWKVVTYDSTQQVARSLPCAACTLKYGIPCSSVVVFLYQPTFFDDLSINAGTRTAPSRTVVCLHSEHHHEVARDYRCVNKHKTCVAGHVKWGLRFVNTVFQLPLSPRTLTFLHDCHVFRTGLGLRRKFVWNWIYKCRQYSMTSCATYVFSNWHNYTFPQSFSGCSNCWGMIHAEYDPFILNVWDWDMWTLNESHRRASITLVRKLALFQVT